MTDYNALVNELTVTTFNNKKKKWNDNMSKTNALLSFIKSSGNIETESGGALIERDIYAPLTNSNYKRYTGLQTLNTNITDGITAVQFPWKQAATAVVISGRDIRINGQGRTRAQGLVEAKLQLAMNDAETNFNIDMYSDGTSAEQISGLQALVSDAGTGTVGGINSTTYTWWRNLVQSAAAPLDGGGAVTVSSTTIEPLMRGLYNRLTRGQKDKPNVIISDLNYYEFYEQSLRDDRRWTDGGTADAGFQAIQFRKSPVILENSPNSIGSNRMYFLNTNYLKLINHSDVNWDMTQEDRTPTNQDGVIKPILWMGAMIVTNRSLQGILKA